MKKVFKSIVIIAAAAMTLSACNREVEPQQQKNSDGLYEYSFAILEDATKAEIGDENVVWVEGDEVGMFVGSFLGSAPVNVSTSPKTVSISSDQEIPAGTMAYAYFPADETNTDPELAKITLSGTQGGASVSAMPMAGIPFQVQSAVAAGDQSNGAIKFLNLGSLINFKIFSSDDALTGETIQSVSFESNHTIAGTFYLDLTQVDPEDEGTLDIVFMNEEDELKIVTVEQEVPVAADKDEAEPVRMVIIPGMSSGTLTVTTDEATYTKEIPEREFVRSGSRTFGLDLSKAERVPNEEDIPMFVKVTSTADITDGEYLIVNEEGSVAFNGDLETLDAVSNTISVNIEDGIIPATDATEAAVFTIDIAEGTLRSASELYIGVSSNSNGLKQTDNASTYTNSFAIEDGNAVISAIFEGSAMTLRYNKASNQNRFRYYKDNGQQDIQLYKKVFGPAPHIITWILSEIAITNPPAKTEYTVGESFDPTGMVVTATYVDSEDSSNTKTETVDVTSLTISPSVALSLSDTEVTISYGGFSLEQSIIVNAVSYATTGTSNVDLSENNATVNGYDAYKAGTGSVAGSTTISIPEGTTNLHIHAAGWKGENVTLQISGASVIPSSIVLTSNDGISNTTPFVLQDAAISDFYFNLELSGIDSATTLTFEAIEGKRFVIWGVNAEIGTPVTWNLESIAITTEPTKTSYSEGESFDPAGMVVTGHYVDADDNTHTKDAAVTGYTITPSGALALGTTQVTITYQGKTATQAITVTEYIASYDFETIAELNTLATDLGNGNSDSYNGQLTNAVVSYVPDSGNAIIKDATGSILVYKNNHGLLQGQTFSGDLSVTVKLYYTTVEITALDATFTGTETEVLPATMTLSQLEGSFSTYQNAYVKVEDLTVSSKDGKNISVSDGTKSYIVYDNQGSSSASVGDVITVVGTVADHNGTNQIKVWSSSGITITSSGSGTPETITLAVATFDGKNETYTEGWSTTGTGKGRTDCIIIGSGENITSPVFDFSGYSSVTISIKARRYGSLSGSKATIDASIGGTSVGTTDATGTSATTSLTDIVFTPTSSMTSASLVFTCTNATSAGSTHGAGINTIIITATRNN